MKPIKVFDLHCDTLTSAEKDGQGLVNQELHLSLDRIPETVRLCQCMAIFMPDQYRGEAAECYFDRVFHYYCDQLKMHADRLSVPAHTGDIDRALEKSSFVPLLTVEGGSVLAGKLENLYKLHNSGVRMITLTWNGANEICGGAATGEGFTPFGRTAVSLMEELGIVVDVSHLSDKGFGELCAFSKKPFVASHSNARSICGHRRNLTNEMFREIRDRGGLVGINYFRNFLRDDGDATMDDLLRHVYHFLELGGEDVVALGSDFDGAEMPSFIKGIQSLPELHDALLQNGIPRRTVDKLFYENARRFFACQMEEEQK